MCWIGELADWNAILITIPQESGGAREKGREREREREGEGER